METDLAFDDADLNGLVDGRLERSRAAALSESLASDPQAGARIDAWRRQNDSLRTMFSAVLFEPVPVRLLPSVVPAREGGDARPSDGRPLGHRPAGVLATISVGAALIGFALGALASIGTDSFGLGSWMGRDPSSSAAAIHESRDLAARAVEAHRTFLEGLSGPGEIPAGEGSKLARPTASRLGPGGRIPDLGRQGWSFIGGHIVPGRSGPAAFLAYANGGDRLGLTVSRASAQGDGLVVTISDEGSPLGVATWSDGALDYALTTDRGQDWLERNIAPLRAGVTAQVRAADGSAAPP